MRRRTQGAGTRAGSRKGGMVCGVVVYPKGKEKRRAGSSETGRGFSPAGGVLGQAEERTGCRRRRTVCLPAG